MEMLVFQGWEHLFKLAMPSMYESEVIEFYEHLMYTKDEDTIFAIILPRVDGEHLLHAILDLFLMDALTTFQPVNLLALMIENMLKVKVIKDGRYGLGFSYLLTRPSVKGATGEPGAIQNLQVQNAQLKVENVVLRKQVEDQTYQMLKY
ncbi:hypothetical protein HAX54_023075 [Datura stramonium]|uniref:Uncharacterized protein n=1 Tax=Datura stramonium TaxID=4076 RepID=A0ABS8UY18_DATST|nr:hypothetical protein [Datura stramonium]